jgi:hypothetical protein
MQAAVVIMANSTRPTDVSYSCQIGDCGRCTRGDYPPRVPYQHARPSYPLCPHECHRKVDLVYEGGGDYIGVHP